MIKHGFPNKDNKVTITDMSITYTNELEELLKISTDDEGGGTFYKIKSEGWSFDSIEELMQVIDDFKSKVIEND